MNEQIKRRIELLCSNIMKADYDEIDTAYDTFVGYMWALYDSYTITKSAFNHNMKTINEIKNERMIELQTIDSIGKFIDNIFEL